MDSVRTTLVFEQKPDGWNGYAPEVPGTYVQGSTLDGVREKLSEAIYLPSQTNNEQVYDPRLSLFTSSQEKLFENS
jgi:predicted RNase H-like HicB family nuclease